MNNVPLKYYILSFKRDRTCVYLWLIHGRNQSYCKAIILQLKINKLKKNTTFWSIMNFLVLPECLKSWVVILCNEFISRGCLQLLSFPMQCFFRWVHLSSRKCTKGKSLTAEKLCVCGVSSENIRLGFTGVSSLPSRLRAAEQKRNMDTQS